MKRADPQPYEVDFSCADGIFVKSVAIAKSGTLLPQHAHVWDHTSFIARGRVSVWIDDTRLGEFAAPSHVLIRKGCFHRFLTLEDETVILCMHNLHGAEAVAVMAEHELEEIV